MSHSKDFSSPPISQHMFLPHAKKGTHFFLLPLWTWPQAYSKASRRRLQEPWDFQPAFATQFGDPHSDFCARLRAAGGHKLLVVLLRLPDTEARDTHHPLLWGLGLGPTPTGGRSPVQGMLEIHSGRFSLPLQKLRAAWWERPPRQSPDPAFPKRQSSQQGVTSHCKLPGAARGGDLWASNPAHPGPSCFQEPGHSHGAPRSGCARVPSRAQAPGAPHKTLDEQQHKQDQKKLLTHHKAAEELTPAFSFSSVYISVKYIIYSSIGLIVIYYSLELLLFLPYFNHIYASNFAYRSYCLEFIIEIHRIKLK